MVSVVLAVMIKIPRVLRIVCDTLVAHPSLDDVVVSHGRAHNFHTVDPSILASELQEIIP